MSITHIMWYLHCGLVAYLVHLIGKKIIQERIDIQERANMRERVPKETMLSLLEDTESFPIPKEWAWENQNLCGYWVDGSKADFGCKFRFKILFSGREITRQCVETCRASGCLAAGWPTVGAVVVLGSAHAALNQEPN